nr:zinc finger BED domain-containing protein RICESLEEPER 3 [Tanacetum cinerariifolium]
MFPVLSHKAIDILSVQATSIASESAFSISGRVLSIRRTRLTPASLETCMCLKDHLDAQERKQDKSTLETSVDFEKEILDAEVQANKAIPLSDEEIALDAASSKDSMYGPGSKGEEAEANYGYDVYHDDYQLSIMMLYFQFRYPDEIIRVILASFGEGGRKFPLVGVLRTNDFKNSFSGCCCGCS